MSIPWFAPETGLREKELISDVIESNYLNDGQYTRRFEEKIAEFIGVKHCVAVTSGTVAITLALLALGIGYGDEVIVPDLTFIATANAARLAGADVKLVDVERERFTIDTEKIIKKICKKTKAVITVDVNGRGADYAIIETLCKERNLFLVCDSAEALGSRYNGRFIGNFGDVSCFSFSPNKTLTTGQGGMVATNNTTLYYRLLELKDQGRRTQGTGGDDLHPVMGYNFKFTNLQAAIGLAQFEKFQERLEKSQIRDRLYREYLNNFSNITFPAQSHGEVTQWTDILVNNKKNVMAELDNAGIGYRAFWYPIHRQEPYKADDDEFENALYVSEHGLWLPSCFNITKEEIEYISCVIRKIYEV